MLKRVRAAWQWQQGASNGSGNKEAVAMVTRMVGKDEGDGKNGKSNGNGGKEGNCKEVGNGEQ